MPTLNTRVTTAECARVDALWNQWLLTLFAHAAGVTRSELQCTVDESGSQDEPTRRQVWVAPTGATLTLTAEGIASPHGVHGEDLQARATGLPTGVTFSGKSSLDRRSGGQLSVTLEGREGLAAFEAALSAARS